MWVALHSLKAWNFSLSWAISSLMLLWPLFLALLSTASLLRLPHPRLTHTRSPHSPKREIWGKHGIKQCSTDVTRFISAGCLRALVMYGLVPLQEGTQTESIFSKFILQWNSTFLGVSMGLSGLQNTHLEMLPCRLAGNEMALLIKLRRTSETVLWSWPEVKSDTYV